MTTFFKFFPALLFLLSTHLYAAPVNLVVVLDLSDRLLNARQAEEDREMILAAWHQLAELSRREVYLNARHRFSVVAVPQRSTPPGLQVLLDELFLDCAALPATTKRKSIEAFGAQLSDRLDKLYRLANTGNKPTDYAGSDIWQYFNEQLEADLKQGYNNKVLVLTDGYFDFEKSSHSLHRGNRHTNSDFLSVLRKKSNWLEIAQKENYGYLPLSRSFKQAQVMVCGIQPKYEHLQEAEMLCWFWKDWTRRCGMGNTQTLMRSSRPKMKESVSSWVIK